MDISRITVSPCLRCRVNARYIPRNMTWLTFFSFCLTAISREVSKPCDSSLDFSKRSEIWQAPRQQRFWEACQILERCDHYNTQPRRFETSRDLTVRRFKMFLHNHDKQRETNPYAHFVRYFKHDRVSVIAPLQKRLSWWHRFQISIYDWNESIVKAILDYVLVWCLLGNKLMRDAMVTSYKRFLFSRKVSLVITFGALI